MPTPKKGARLGGSPAHQKLILSNLATALFEHGRITTTEAKARALRPVAERLITKARKAHLGENSLHNRRLVLRTIRDKGVVHVLFTEIAPQFAERPGGYTRITKVGPRKGDNAPMAVIELVTEPYQPSAAPARPAASAPATPPETEVADATQPDEIQADEIQADEIQADEIQPDGVAPQAQQEGEQPPATIVPPAAPGAPAEVEAPTVGTDEPEVVEVEPTEPDVPAPPAQQTQPTQPTQPDDTV